MFIKSLAFSLLFITACSLGVVGQNERIFDEDIGPGQYKRIGGLSLSGVETIQLEPGKMHQFNVLSRHPMQNGVYYKVIAPTVWSVTPEKGAKIDQAGLLTIDANAVNGAIFTVTAAVTIKEEWQKEGYTATETQKVLVFEPKVNPLVGIWRQARATPCNGQAEEDRGIRELEFRADGGYSVTLDPFEVYKDYWGKFAFDLKAGTIKFTADGGNRVPTELDLEGGFRLADKVLTLDGISLWTKDGSRPVCAMTFERPDIEAPLPPLARLFDESKFSTQGYLKMLMDGFFVELMNNANAQGYLMIYPESHRRHRQIERIVREWMRVRRYDNSRLTLFSAPNSSPSIIQMWVVPAGAENPKPNLKNAEK